MKKTKKSIANKFTDEDKKIFEKLAKLAKEKGITDEDIIELCRQAGNKIHEEENGDEQ